MRTRLPLCCLSIVIFITILVPRLYAVTKPNPACPQTQAGYPITEADEIRWPASPGVVRIEVLGNDYDIEGDPLKVTSKGTLPPGVGTLEISTDQQAIHFTPGTKPAADVSFSYVASDGARTTSGTVTIRVSEPTPGPGAARPDFSVKCEYLRCSFKAISNGVTEIRAFDWNFLENPGCSRTDWRSYTYTCFMPQAGTYHVGLTAIRFNGERVSTPTLRPIQVQLDPAQIRWTVQDAPAGNAAATSGLKVSYIMEYTNRDLCDIQCPHSFDFGDDSPVVPAGKNPTNLGWQGGATSHAYKRPGIYNVKVIVGGGQTPEIFEKAIEVRNKVPEILNFNVTGPSSDGVVTVSGDPSDELDISWIGDTPDPNGAWYTNLDFGDGTHKTIDNGGWGDSFSYTHRYKAPGKYTVTARLADGFGAAGVYTRQVDVTNVPPVPAFVFDCDPAIRRCTFDASGSKDAGGSIASYNWKLTAAGGTTVHLPAGTLADYVFPATSNDWTMHLTVVDNNNTTVALSRPVQFPAFTSQPLEYYTLLQRRIFNSKTAGTPVSRETAQLVDLDQCCGIKLPGYAAIAVNVSVIEPNDGSGELLVGPGFSNVWGPLMDVYGGSAFTNTPGSSNAVITTVDGKFLLWKANAGSSAHVIIDLYGVFAPKDFVPPADLAGPHRFRAIEPCRALDTRFAPPALSAGSDRLLKLRDVCGIGSDAVAATGGIASVNYSSPSQPDGYLSIFPSDRSDGNGTSGLNLKSTFTRFNGMWTRLSGRPADDVKLRVNVGASDAVVDTSGYFVPRAAGGLRYVALPPCRLGSLQLASGHQKTFKVAGNCGVPQGAAAAVITHRVNGAVFTGHAILYGAYRQPPGTSNGNFSNSSDTPLINSSVTATSVIRLEPGFDEDAAVVAFYGAAPPDAAISSGPFVEPWVWGYFTAVEDNTPPVANFTFNCWGSTCNFDASGSTDEGSIAKYEWKFLSSAPAVLGKTATYTFPQDGTGVGDHAVQLAVTDDKGATALATRTVRVRYIPHLKNANYFSLPPCRLYDSTSNVLNGVVPVRGHCGIPAGTGEIVPVLNVALVSSDAGDGVLSFGLTQAVPYSSAMLPQAFHRAPLLFASESSISFAVTKAARVIVDAVGYYRTSDAAAAPAKGPVRFTPLEPCRAFDSRVAGPTLTGTRVDISVAWNCGVPAGATATAQTLTAVNPSVTGGANIRMWPSNLAVPDASVLNIRTGLNRANFTVTELGTTNGAAKDLALQLSSGTSEFVLDTAGYFSPDSKQQYAHVWPFPLTDAPATLSAGVPVSFKVKGTGGVPLHATAVLVQAAGSGSVAGGHLTLYAAGALRPATSVLNFVSGQTVTNTVIVPLAAAGDVHLNAAATLAGGGTAKVALTVLGYFSDPGDWGTAGAQIEWNVVSQIGLGLELDVTSINLDPISPDHEYYVDWGDNSGRWTADTGSILLNARPSHTYATTGPRNVTVAVVRRSDGAEVKFTKPVRIGNAPPVVDLVFDCTLAPTCTFDASRSTDDYDHIEQYFWDVGPGYQTTEPTLTHTFPGNGTYPIVVTAWDGVSESTAVKRTVQVRVAGANTGYLFQPATPCRLFDSRSGSPLTNNLATTLQVSGQCGIPATAKAVALTVAVVTATGDGYLRVYEPGKLTETASQTFSATALPRSNHVTMSLDGTGKLALMPSVVPAQAGGTGTAHVIVDVTGYYSSTTGLGFRTLTPCRAIDSRSTNPPSPLISGTVSPFKLRGRCGIPEELPAGGAAAAMNLAVVMPATFGNVVMVPSSGTDTTSTSTVNMPAGRNTAAGATIGLGLQTGSDLSLRYISTGPGNATHWIVDTTGYWATGNELRYYPLPGCRMLDTRQTYYGYPRLAAGVEQHVQARGNCGVPAWAKAIAVNATAIDGTTAGNLVMWPAGTPRPVTSSVNWGAGEPFIGNMTIVPVGAGWPDLSVRAEVSGAHLALDVFGYFANPADVPAGYFTATNESEEQEQ